MKMVLKGIIKECSLMIVAMLVMSGVISNIDPIKYYWNGIRIEFQVL